MRHSGIPIRVHGTVVGLSISEEIQNIPQGACISFVDFGILATSTSDSREFLVLNIEEFSKPSTSCSKLAFFKLRVLTFRALPVGMLHLVPLSSGLDNVSITGPPLLCPVSKAQSKLTC
jgi:hypothetical protein